jgi:hypothetical protein
MAKFELCFNRDDVPAGPSAWETFLLGAGVAENTCSKVLSGRTRKGREIRSWVSKHYAKNYVPEHILEALGLRRQLMLRWQREEYPGDASVFLRE